MLGESHALLVDFPEYQDKILMLTATDTEFAEDAKQYTQVIFECERNDPVTVRFYQDSERAVMTRNNEDIELTQQPTASGFSYSNGPNSIRGKGDDLTVHIGRMAAIHCRAM